MSPVSLRRSRVRLLLLWAAPLLWLGCSGGGGTDIVLPSLSVTTTTDGVELDPDGYTVAIDGSASQAIGLSATLVVDRLSDGPHSVELTGLASNCSPQSQNPQSVTIRSGSTSSVSFAVRCNASSGAIEVTTSTAGTAPDPDGFTLVIDASPRGLIGTAASASVPGLTPGSHTIGLTGLAANCAVEGENPRSVAVSPGETLPVSFNVTCSDPGPGPGPAPGALRVTVNTSGSNPDPDGYGVSLDGGASAAIGVSASMTLSSLSSGAHQVELVGVALNCTVGGANPRSVTVASARTANVTFNVTCSAPAPDAGTLQVTTATTGQDLDASYTVAVDNGSAQPIGANATLSLPNVSAAEHQVRLQGIAANCSLQGANPVRVTVASGAVAQAAFAVTCTAIPPQPGSLRITVQTSGASQDNSYTVSVDGGNALTFSGSRTVENLTPGSHSVLLGDIAANCTVGGANPQTVSVPSGQTLAVTFPVSCVSTAPAVNLRIQRISLTQSTQDAAGDVPLIQNRDGYIRVFVTATGSNTAAPGVRLRLYRSGAVIQTFTIPAPGNSTPSAVQEGTLQSSWNLKIPGSLIQPNTAVLAEVDPDNAVPESNESDNSFPASGIAQPLTVQAVAPAVIRLVPITQSATGSTGSVANASQLVDLLRRMYPLGSVSTEVRQQPFTAQGPLQPLNQNNEWNQILSDLEALRIADDATDRTYYGLVRLDYQFGTVGNGFVGAPSAIGTDAPAEVRRVLAHELGHTWSQLHTPCGTPPGVDPAYPYPGGSIGVYGYDVTGNALKQPSMPDIMGYCENPWISDYTYQRVLNYRRTHPMTSAAAQTAQPCLLVWGRIENGKAVLEPGFQIVTRPRLPESRGPYTLEAQGADGASLFSISFEATPTADDPRGGKHFAFAIPLDRARMTRLGSMRLGGPGIQLQSVTRSQQQLQQGAAQDRITAKGEAGAVRLEWNAAAHPMIMVRDPDTDEVLSFARGGAARVWTPKSAVDLEVSNGVGSQRLRLAISR